MQDVPIHCPADIDATDAERLACEVVKPGRPKGTVTTLDSGGGGGDQPPKKPPVKED